MVVEKFVTTAEDGEGEGREGRKGKRALGARIYGKISQEQAGWCRAEGSR